MSAPPPMTATLRDPITETLELTGARCALSCGLTAAGNWALAFPAPGRLKIQAVLQGTIWLVMEGIEHPVRLATGDIAVLAGDRGYILASDPAVPPVDMVPRFRAPTESFTHAGDEGLDAVTIGGHIDLNTTGKDLLLSALPPLMHVGAATAEAPAACWLMDQTLREIRSDAPGAAFAAEHLAQLLLVQVFRTFLTSANADAYPTGWLRALADERIAPALRLIHGDPAHPWTLTELARAAAMSRTTFAQRFKETAGVPPLTYLCAWRMRLARHTLRREDTSVSSIAASLGYRSESAFSNAFKRTTGLSPRRYRDAARTGD
ncbi:AraC family transcriptional regulator [Streptomyces qinzhouensis]|uniref:AraC family transcriptional regulator n=1 Tax=Streptomyces qinzhouensis TaxID=2599401 RepID=A0A5B8JKB1_9ACTN|nr:AraC family transcriptional regulator [Streptomyces qinzhouensis]QDY77953.1 AraC family transcriptional regulator [Streptomyces qinzhouensis]